MPTDASTVQLVFAGEVLEGFSTAEVKQRVARALKLDDAKLRSMFSGKRVVIKRGVDAADADRWVAKFGAMGARLHIVPAPEAPSAQPSAPGASLRAGLPNEETTRPSRGKRPSKRIWLGVGGALAMVAVLGTVYKMVGPERGTPPDPQAPVSAGQVVDAGKAPLPPDSRLESRLGGSAAVAEFHRYMSASGRRAFAISGNGAWGWNAGASAPEQAIELAISDCDKRRQANTAECYLVHVDEQWMTD